MKKFEDTGSVRKRRRGGKPRTSEDDVKSEEGGDFLKHFGLLMDVKNQKLLDSTTNLCVKGITSHMTSISSMFGVKSDHKASYDANLQQ